MKEYLSIENIKEILNDIDGECVPLVFIDHIDIFYNDGSVKSVEGDKVRKLFPEIKNTTMGILKHNNDILEINVKVDIIKIHQYLNYICKDIQHITNKIVKRYLTNKGD